MSGAIVSLSGGQDSATCLFWARKNYDTVEAVSFDYGQRHAVELECAEALAHRWDIAHRVIAMPALMSIGGASLIDNSIPSKLDATDTGNEFAAARGLPSSFVPGRNILLLGCAAAYGLTRGLSTLVSGICQEDEAGYPDCRAAFASALQTTVQIGTDTPEFQLVTPLMYKSKAETWQMAKELGVLDEIVELTHTCYNGNHSDQHQWGYGCNECPACQTRAKGFNEAFLVHA